MLNIKNVFITLFVLLSLQSCKKENCNNNFLTLKLDKASVNPIWVSDLFSSIEYVCLETLPECLLKEDEMEVAVTDKYIIANNMYWGGSYLFDRKTGEFLYEIGKRGQGPNEYYFVSVCPFNEEYELFYVERVERIGIDINTNKEVERVFLMKSDDAIKTGLINDEMIFYSVNNIYKMDSSYYIAYQNNIKGDDPHLLVIFDKDGNVIKRYPNHQKYIKYKNFKNLKPGLFYKYKEQLFFKEYQYNDTVFMVNLDTIIPHIIFDLGEKKPDYEEQENPDKNRSCYWIDYVRETDKYIFFSYYGNNEGYYDGYYNKETKRINTSLSTSKEMRGLLYENDLYPPVKITTINKYEEVIDFITATNMLNCIEKNKQTTYPEKFYSLKNDDNPIIVIATLK